MKVWTIIAPRLGLAIGALLVGACASLTGPSPIDPAACYDRDFAIYFEGQDTTLTPAAREVMDAQGDVLRGCVISEVRIIGAAGDEGSEPTTEQISIRRAEVIADYLARREGWPRSRFHLLATGERGAVTDEGLNVPMRRRARIIVSASPP